MSRSIVENFDPERFAALRERAGLTRAELAHKANLSRNTIFHWESGVYQPTIDSLVQTLSILRATPSEVVTLSSTQAPTLADLRVAVGLARQDVYEYLGLSRSGWSDIERGLTRVSDDKIAALAILFNVDEATIRAAASETLGINNRPDTP